MDYEPTGMIVMNQLTEYLALIKTELVSNTSKIEILLADCWEEFSGNEAQGMEGYKLHGRVNDVRWKPPILTFWIERHGGTVLGSSRAERHKWTLNLDKKSASCENVGYRQIRPMQRRLDVRPMAEEIAQLIIDNREDDRLAWKKDGSVIVQIGRIVPDDSAAQTTIGRRKRFRKTLEELLGNAGWRMVRANVYAPPTSERHT